MAFCTWHVLLSPSALVNQVEQEGQPPREFWDSVLTKLLVFNTELHLGTD